MGTQPQSVKEEACAEKRRLSEAMVEAANAVLAVEAEERALVINGATVALLRIAQRLRAKRAEWESTRKAYQAHIQEHGC